MHSPVMLRKGSIVRHAVCAFTRPVLTGILCMLLISFLPVQVSPAQTGVFGFHTSSCLTLIHLGNDGLIMDRGKPGYSRSGDVWLHCPERSIPLTRTGDVFSYGMIPDGIRMAVVRHPRRDEAAPAILEEIDLRSGAEIQEEQLSSRLFHYEVVPTCGTVILFGYVMDKMERGAKVPAPLRTEALDLGTNRPWKGTNFNMLRCNADRAVVLRKIGPPWASLGTLYTGETGENVLARKVGDFDVSSNGRYAAFTTGSKVCIFKSSEPNASPICVGGFTNRGRLYVSDDGEVWLTGDSESGCPGKEDVPEPPAFTCDAIFAWGKDRQAIRLAAYGFVDPREVSLLIGRRILAFSNEWKRVAHL